MDSSFGIQGIDMTTMTLMPRMENLFISIKE